MMQIQFGLAWLKPGKLARTAFKQGPASALFEEYRERISKFTPCEASGIDLPNAKLEVGHVYWICDRGPSSRIMSSEDIGRELSKCLDGGAKKLSVVIGGPDGIPDATVKRLKPTLLWSFGKMTLPHELAAVVASEQLYRAWSIVRRLPYHSGH